MTRASVGVGLAGLGQHGVRYARHLLAGDVPGARLVAVCRRDAAAGRAWAREQGVRYHGDVDALAGDPAVDLVALVLPPGLHPGAIETVAARGRAMIVEKPLAAGREGATRARLALESGGLFGSVAQTLRYAGVVRALLARRAELGPLHLVAISQRFEPTERAWLDDPAHGGLLLNTGVHGIDLLHLLTGGRVVWAAASARRIVTRRAADAFAAALRLEPGGVLATLDNSRATAARSGRIELVGRDGQLAGDHVHGWVALGQGREARPLPAPPRVPTVREALRDALDAFREERDAPIPFDEGAAAVEGVELMRDSLREETPGARRAGGEER